MCKEKNNNENDEEENKKAKNYIEQNDTYYETPKRSITTNVGYYLNTIVSVITT